MGLALAVALYVIVLQLHHGEADNIFPNNGGDANSFDQTNVLDCADDNGGRFNVPLLPPNSSSDHLYWLPEESELPAPENIQWVRGNFGVLRILARELQGIDLRVQSLFEDNFSESLLRTASVCAEVDKNETDTIDDPQFIVLRLIRDRVNMSNVNGTTFSSGNINRGSDETAGMIGIFQALRCEVIHQWTDIGATYLPPFLAAGRCLDRVCSVPAVNGQTCRPDVSTEANFRRVPGLRWDCCWELDEIDPPYKFDCGWRKVNIPILCDCDCACPRF